MNRFDDAVAIQCGACNISGIARSLVKAADAARQDGVLAEDDPAVRLIIHQLAFLVRVAEIDNTPGVYLKLRQHCEERVDAHSG